MSTVCKIIIQKSKETLESELNLYLSQNNLVGVRSESQWPLAVSGDKFQPDEEFPSEFSIGVDNKGLGTIYYNSFSLVNELAIHFCKRMSCGVVVNVYQSTATASRWAYFINGSMIRCVEAGDGEVSASDGEKLEFEGEHVGTNISMDGEEAQYSFDESDMDRYNKGVGIPGCVYSQDNEGWINVSVSKIVVRNPRKEIEGTNPWWKLW